MADKSIGELDPVPATPIGDLPQILDLYDDSLIPVEQQGTAMRMTGRQWKQYAEASVTADVNSAKAAAEQAAQSAQAAGNARAGAQSAAGRAETAADEAAESLSGAQTASQQAQKSAADAKSAAGTAAKDAAGAVRDELSDLVKQAQTAEAGAKAGQTASETARDKAEAAGQKATEQATAAQTARTAAEAAQSGAAKSAEGAANSLKAAQTAQTNAEAARDAAQASKTAAQTSADNAAKSADTAKQYSGKPPIIQNDTWWTWDAGTGAYKDTGQRSLLNYDKTYTSFEELMADEPNQPVNTVAIIASSVEEEDNAKLYIMGQNQKWRYLADLSGFTGVGISTWERTAGNGAPGTYDTYTVTWTDGRSFSYRVYNGRNGEGAGDMEAEVYDPNGKRTMVTSVNGGTGDVTIGGRNLILGTRDVWTERETDGAYVFVAGLIGIDKYGLSAGDYLTFSLAIDATDSESDWFASIVGYSGETVAGDNVGYVFGNHVAGTIGLSTATYKIPAGVKSIRLSVNRDANSGSDKIKTKLEKAERGTVPTDWSPAPEDKQNMLTGTEGQVVGFDENGEAVAAKLGGRNLLRNSDFSSGIDPWYITGGSKISVDTIQDRRVIKVDCSSITGASGGLIYRDIQVELNTAYIAHGFIYTATPQTIQINLQYVESESNWPSIKRTNVSLKAGWNQFCVSGVSNNTYDNIMLVFAGPKNAVFYLWHPKFELGSIATDWSPAPEDMVRSVNGATGAVEIGGRNLLYHSRELDRWVKSSSHVAVEDGTAVISSSGETSNHSYGLRYWIGGGAYAEFADKTVTASFEVESDDWDAVTDAAGQSGLNAVVMSIELASGAPGGANTGDMGAYLFARLGSRYFRPAEAVNGKWMRMVSVPLTIDDALWDHDVGKTGTPYDYLIFRFHTRMNGTVRFRNPKLELGTVATDFSIAPEETVTSVNGVQGAIEVGGRNYCKNSAAFSKFTSWNSCTLSNMERASTAETPSGVMLKATIHPSSEGATSIGPSVNLKGNGYMSYYPKAGEIWTASAWVKCSATRTLKMRVPKLLEVSPTGPFAVLSSVLPAEIGPKWKKVSQTIRVETDIPDTTQIFASFQSDEDATAFRDGDVIWVSSYKLERGNTATDWTPAPEDLLPADGTAKAAEKLATPRSINGVAFDGTKDITVPRINPTNIGGQTLDADTLNFANGPSGSIEYYFSRGSGDSANITNIPVKGQAFSLVVRNIRYISPDDYITEQIFVSSDKSDWRRWCTNGVWSSWVKDETKLPISNNITGGTDFDTLTLPGYYMRQGTNTNAPASGDTHYHVLVLALTDVTNPAANTNYIRQVAYDIRSTALWTRSKINGTWRSWERLYTTGYKPSATDVGALPSGGKATTAGTADKVAHTLTLSGAVSGTFDGSKDVNLTVPTIAGPQGPAGANGVSPTVTVSKSGSVTTITIKDANGEKKATINDGAKGDTGSAGPTGPQGAAGPNTVSTTTTTNITGLIKGSGSKVAQAVAGTDYITPANLTAAIQDAILDSWSASY